MKIDVLERRIINLADGRTMSLHPGIIEVTDQLGEELIAAKVARKPPRTKPGPPPILSKTAEKEVTDNG